MTKNGSAVPPEDLQRVVVDWDLYDPHPFFDDMKKALEPFALNVYLGKRGGEEYYLYVTTEVLDREGVEDLEDQIGAYFKAHGDPAEDEEDYGLEYPWREVVSDWKLAPYAITNFKRAVEYFQVKMYIRPSRRKIQNVFLSRTDLTDQELEAIEYQFLREEGRYVQEEPEYWILISDRSIAKVRDYQEALSTGTRPGRRFARALEELEIEELSSEEFLEILANTKEPHMFAESMVSGDGTDWTKKELSILGDLSVAVPVTVYDNGWHTNPDVHEAPFQATLLFTPGALLANQMGVTPPDFSEVVQDGQIDPEAYYRLYERRLLPPLLYASRSAGEQERQALVTVPCLGCGQFAGPFYHQLGPIFRDVLQRLLETHHRKLEHLRAVYFDPYRECENQRFEIDGISLLVRPLMKGNEHKPQLCRPETYQEKGDDFSLCDLFSIVAWDHVSWPGNDFYRGVRMTDDGVKAAATDSMRVMTGIKGSYDPVSHGYLPPAEYEDWSRAVIEHKVQFQVEDNLLVFLVS